MDKVNCCRSVSALTNCRPSSAQVTVSLLQTLKFLPLDMEYKQALVRYRVASLLGREMEPLLQRTDAFLREAAGGESGEKKGPRRKDKL